MLFCYLLSRAVCMLPQRHDPYFERPSLLFSDLCALSTVCFLRWQNTNKGDPKNEKRLSDKIISADRVIHSTSSWANFGHPVGLYEWMLTQHCNSWGWLRCQVEETESDLLTTYSIFPFHTIRKQRQARYFAGLFNAHVQPRKPFYFLLKPIDSLFYQ